MKRTAIAFALALMLAAWTAARAEGPALTPEERQVIETLIIGTPTEVPVPRKVKVRVGPMPAF